ncbi:hypothetical protein SK128_023597 [Halocaridina rubra]|uniref:Uncharacterized protein n=1 Tax=Halocaridina rubra TaxID=373956 RepID=A0AAN8WJP8_HALRR
MLMMSTFLCFFPKTEECAADVTEGKLKEMYSVPEKKIKSQELRCEGKTSDEENNPDFCDDISQNSSNTVDDEYSKGSSTDFVPNVMETRSEEESTPLAFSGHKSRNPFAKAQSSCKNNTVPTKQFSALKAFSKIAKTVVDPDTLIHSRYFSSPTSPSPKSTISKDKSDIVTAANGDISRMEGEDSCRSESCDKSSVYSDNNEQIEPCEGKPEISNTIKAPLSPVQTNAVNVQSTKTFKWGKLTNMFSYKPKNVLDIESSPAAMGTFKPVVSPLTNLLSVSKVSKENSILYSPPIDASECLPLSQQSCVSNISCVSDVGSVDNESFGLTPSSTPETLIGSSHDQSSDILTSPTSMIRTTSPLQKSHLQKPTSQKGISKARPLGLSRTQGKARKGSDLRQRNLRDMFACKREAPVL